MALSMHKCDELVRIRKESEMEYRPGICLGKGPEGRMFRSRFEVRTSRMQVYSHTAGTTGWGKSRIRKKLLSKSDHNFGHCPPSWFRPHNVRLCWISAPRTGKCQDGSVQFHDCHWHAPCYLPESSLSWLHGSDNKIHACVIEWCIEAVWRLAPSVRH
jgi:hypothetical protein